MLCQRMAGPDERGAVEVRRGLRRCPLACAAASKALDALHGCRYQLFYYKDTQEVEMVRGSDSQMSISSSCSGPASQLETNGD